jgi:hypothetical protein
MVKDSSVTITITLKPRDSLEPTPWEPVSD